MEALDTYRARFRPSAQLDKPYVMLGFNVFAADTDQEALLLASSMSQAFVNLRTGRPGQLPPPVDGYAIQLPPAARAMLDDVLSCSAIGSPQTVRESLVAFVARTRPQELMITSQIFDHTARLHSYKITAQVRDQL
jgi:alkanesulfonate monooxygenase SsuD/methylene tetrahydromethanopterin reductase-like flavin-dependent oxidoreductase (luciferase family)